MEVGGSRGSEYRTALEYTEEIQGAVKFERLVYVRLIWGPC